MKLVRAQLPKGPDTLQYEEGPIPKPKPDEYLIKVHAAGVMFMELTWDVLYYDIETGEPRTFTPGCDFAGVVVDMGEEARQKGNINEGDEVYALTRSLYKLGTMAEYTTAPISELAKKPKTLSMVEAGGVPQSALTAYQALFVHAKLQKGQNILITGAAGGTGIWAVQMARNAGAHVVATASAGRSFEILRDLGADEIINYKETQLNESVGEFDVVLDTVGGETFDRCWTRVKTGGWLMSITISPYNCEAETERGQQIGVNTKFFIVDSSASQLAELAQMLDEGLLKPVIDTVFPFDQVVEAYKYGAEGHIHGKLVVRVAEETL